MESVEFTADNGLLTISNKICRPALEIRYKTRLNELYQNVERRHALNAVKNAVSDVLGVTPGVNANFQELGGDSLAAAKISSILGERGFKISAHSFLQSGSLSELADTVSRNASEIDVIKEAVLDPSINADEALQQVQISFLSFGN